MNWFVRKRKRKDEKEISALAGNRTRVNCLEGSYAHHYTTNASMRVEGQFLVNEYILRITWIGLRNSEKQSAGPWNRTTNIKEFSGRFFSFAIAKPPFQGFLHLNLMNYPWKSKNIKVKKKTLFHLFFIYSHIQASCFHHFVKTPILSQSRKVQEKTAKNKLFLVEKKQERAEKLWDVHSLKGSLSVRPTQCGLLYKQGSPASTNMPIFLFDLWPFGGKKKTKHHEMTVSDCWLHDRWKWDSQIFNKWALRNGSTVKGNKICTVWSILIAWFLQIVQLHRKGIQ